VNEHDFELLRDDLKILTERSATMNQELSSLAGALVHVNELQQQQQKIEKTARIAATRVEEVAANSATRDDLAEIQSQRRRAVRNWYIALIVSVLCVMTIGIGGVAAATAYHDQQVRFQKTQYNNCVLRNQSASATRNLIGDLIQAERSSIDPPTANRLITALQAAEAKQALVSCSSLLKD
jgi:hypothetical protein